MLSFVTFPKGTKTNLNIPTMINVEKSRVNITFADFLLWVSANADLFFSNNKSNKSMKEFVFSCFEVN